MKIYTMRNQKWLDEENYDDDNDNDDDDMQTFEEWRIEFEIKNAESARKLKEDISDIMNEKIDNSRHELSKMLDKGFSKMQKHIDTNINNVVVTMNEKIVQQVDYFDNMVLQHQMTISTFGDFKTCLDELSSRVDNVTSMVEGMVVGPQSHYEGPPTVASAIGRPVNLIGDQQFPENRQRDTHVIPENGQRDMQRFSGIGPTVGGPTGPVITDPNRVNAPFSAVFGPIKLNEAEMILVEIQGRDSHVPRRSNVSGRTSGGLRLTQNTERRNPDAILNPSGPIGPLPGREFPTRVVPGLVRRPPP